MTGVFISYRRPDSAYALLLYKALVEKFGAERVFRDLEGIQPGANFDNALDQALRQSGACLVIVGKGWLDGLPRLAEPNDWARREIETVLRAKGLVVPCLVGGSKMPPPGSVPGSIDGFLHCEATTIGDEYFDRDTSRLLEAVNKALTAAAPKRRTAGAAATATNYKQQRAVELLKRQVSRLQVRGVELIQSGDVDRALDELSEGFELIMQLLDWSPGDLSLDLQLAYLYKTLFQALAHAGRGTEARKYRDLALGLFTRVANAPRVAVAEKAGALNGIGNIQYERHEFQQSVASYRAALKLVPGYAYAWHDLLAALLQLAQKGTVDLAAMEEALTQLKATGAGTPGLGASHLAAIEHSVARWRHATAAKPTGRSTDTKPRRRTRSPRTRARR